MLVIALVPILVMLLGLGLWFIASNGKVQEAGRLLFFVGAFWLVQSFAGDTIRIGK